MLKNFFWAGLTLILCLLVVFVISLQFDFDTMEGRGAKKKTNVKWVFKNQGKLDGVAHYILTQLYRHENGHPEYSVSGRYWLENGGYLEAYRLSLHSFEGSECLGFLLEDYRMKCTKNGEKKSIHACTSSFLSRENIIPKKGKLSDIIEYYDLIKTYLENYPSERERGQTYKGADIPDPIFSAFEIYPDTEVKCWVEKVKEDISVPSAFECSEVYHRCEASPSIKIVK